MRKFILSLAAIVLATAAQAIPAYRGVLTATLPDGTTIDYRLHGDEHFHYMTTADGYTVLKDRDGYLKYARVQNGELTITDVRAHDAAQRTAQETALLQDIGTHAVAQQELQQGRARRAAANTARRSKVSMLQRGLVILIQFNDTTFSRSDIHTVFQDMMDKKNYTGYTNPDGSRNAYGTFPGSVRDYYYDNSMGQYEPRFDVVGPVTVGYSVNEPQGTEGRIPGIFRDAINQLDATVDFSQYDFDNDGYVDVLYFIFAGTSAASSSDSDHLWPHESNISNYRIKKDGVTMGMYSCSTEFIGERSYNILDGIGTPCHEFGHALGLMDHYDTDYALSGGQSHDLGDWDLMAAGCDLNMARTPASLSIFERYQLGWAQPQIITEPGEYTLNPLNTSNEGYIIKTPVNKEFFIIDNRQRTRWDAYLPGHGMTVCRVDSTSTSKWIEDKVNTDPTRLYYEMLRAGGTNSGDLASDPFPGTMNSTLLTSSTLPSLKTWSGEENQFAITDITEVDGVITFTVRNASSLNTLVEDFEGMDVTTNTGLKNVEGSFANWSFAKSNVTAPGESNCDGEHAVAIKNPSAVAMATPVSRDIDRVSCNIYNPTTVTSKFTLYQSLNNGTTWTIVKTSSNADAISVAGNSKVTISWPVSYKNTQEVMLRINMTAGNKNTANYLDNITLYFNGEPGGRLKGDVNCDGEVSIADVTALVNLVMNGSSNDYSDVNEDGETSIADVTTLVNMLMSN